MPGKGIDGQSAWVEQTTNADGTTKVTFYFSDAGGNPTDVQVEIDGVSRATQGGVAVFQLAPNSAAILSITDRYDTHTQSFYIEEESQTIVVNGYTGFSEE